MGAITINPGDSWTTKLTGRGTPDTITVTNVGGTPHRPGNITSLLVAGDEFILQDWVRILGSRELTGLTENATYPGVWEKSGETGGPTTGPGTLWSEYAGNQPYEDLFLNGKPLRQIAFVSVAATVANLNDREWTWDGTGNIIYVKCSNPEAANQTLELSEERVMFNGTATGITWRWENAPTSGDGRGLPRLRNMPSIEMWATAPQNGVFDLDSASGWTVSGIQIRLNHGGAIKIGVSSLIEFCRINWNGQIGIGCSGAHNAVLRNNEFAFNNYNGFAAGWEAGAFKIAFTDGDEAYGNYVHHNGGAGMWWDIQNSNQRIHHNFSIKNLDRNIFYEISYGPAEIYNNHVADSAYEGWYPAKVPTASWPWGAGILISSSEAAHVYDNFIRFGRFDSGGRSDGMAALRQDRAYGVTITDISKANPAVVTHSSDPTIKTGKVVVFTSVTGMTELMNTPDADGKKRYTVTVIDDTHFSLDGVDSTLFGTYVSSVDGIEWRTVDCIFARNIVQCDREGQYIAGAFDDHTNAIDSRAHGDAANNQFIANQYYDNPGTGSHFSFLGDFGWSVWQAKANVNDASLTASAYVPSPVVVT